MAVSLGRPLFPSPSPPGVRERLDYHHWDLLGKESFIRMLEGEWGRGRGRPNCATRICWWTSTHLIGLPASPCISRIYLGPISDADGDDGDGRYYTVRLSMLVPPESRRVSPTRFALLFLAIYCSPGPANSSSFLAARPFNHREYRKYSTKTRVRELENSLQRISIVKILFYYIVSFDVLSEILGNLYWLYFAELVPQSSLPVVSPSHIFGTTENRAYCTAHVGTYAYEYFSAGILSRHTSTECVLYTTPPYCLKRGSSYITCCCWHPPPL